MCLLSAWDLDGERDMQRKAEGKINAQLRTIRNNRHSYTHYHREVQGEGSNIPMCITARPLDPIKILRHHTTTWSQPSFVNAIMIHGLNNTPVECISEVELYVNGILPWKNPTHISDFPVWPNRYVGSSNCTRCPFTGSGTDSDTVVLLFAASQYNISQQFDQAVLWEGMHVRRCWRWTWDWS